MGIITITSLSLFIINLNLIDLGMARQKLIIAITGASGVLYTQQLFKKLQALHDQWEDIAILLSGQGKEIWNYENDSSWQEIPFTIYDIDDFNAPFASGSAGYHCMIICPCSMGTLGRIANGTSDNLIARSADVMLKERRKLILVPREAPLNLIHINNMKTVTEAGGIICPACPSFYSRPGDIHSLANTVVERILKLAGLEFEAYQWDYKK